MRANAPDETTCPLCNAADHYTSTRLDGTTDWECRLCGATWVHAPDWIVRRRADPEEEEDEPP